VRKIATLAASALFLSAPVAADAAVMHGVVVGDVTDSTALLWARSGEEGTLQVQLTGGGDVQRTAVSADPTRDYTARVPITGLAPDTDYHYRVRFDRGPAATGVFHTAPAPEHAAPLRLDFGGDVAGQDVCRDSVEGFPILKTVRARRPDVFMGLGDMIYADDVCDPVGRYGNSQLPGVFPKATDLPTFWQHYRYARSEDNLQRVLRSADYVAVWDDHEVINDFGPATDIGTVPPYTPGVHLIPPGLHAFLDYTPVASAEQTAGRLYRSLRWGRNAEVFVLDTRQYRDPNFAPDSATTPKTMLGAEQLAWLKQSLLASDARWKVIVSSVPMSIPTGFPPTNGRDGWANYDQNTGYEHELLDILGFMHANRINNSVWITTDVHFAEAFRYTPFAEDPDFHVNELVTGPMNAGIFPTTAFDTTLNPERLVLFAPPSIGAVRSWAEAKHWFNFGELDFARGGALTMRIVNTAGSVEFEQTLRPPLKDPPGPDEVRAPVAAPDRVGHHAVGRR
jgi:alkaline phosphatase D